MLPAVVTIKLDEHGRVTALRALKDYRAELSEMMAAYRNAASTATGGLVTDAGVPAALPPVG
jgi:hypothetical protein